MVLLPKHFILNLRCISVLTSFLWCSHTCSFLFHDTKTILPYRIDLTKVFCYFGVDLADETFTKFYHTHRYKHNIFLPMFYSFDKTRKAYHCVVAGYDIFIYTWDILTHYLLDEYFGLTGIPHNDEEDAEIPWGDEGSPSDAPLPSDDFAIADLVLSVPDLLVVMDLLLHLHLWTPICIKSLHL